MESFYGKNNKEELPLEYYLDKYRSVDPEELSARCDVPYSREHCTFSMELLGEQFTVSHPDFTMAGPRALSKPECILFLRYLLDGSHALPGGQYLTYREFPWGEVYLRQFTGRCIERFARTYGNRPELLRSIMEHLPAEAISQSDVGYQVTLMKDLTIQFLLWLGDDEFPPSGQILFSDNFRYAFTAEDMANIGDIVLNRMKVIGIGLAQK